MTAVLQFFAGYSILIYLLLGIGLLFAGRAIFRARRELRAAVFGLERELAHRHLGQGITALTLVIIIGLAEVVLTVFLIPSLPALSIITTPTLNPLITPTGTIPGEFLATINALTPQPSLTAQATGCIPGQIMITKPKAGDVIIGQITLTGTADIPNFGFYKYEFSPSGANNWLSIGAGNQVKQNGDLGNWNTSLITPGYYDLRLVVTDNLANLLPACSVPVQIVAP